MLKTMALTRRVLVSVYEEIYFGSNAGAFGHWLTFDDVYAGKGYRYEKEKEIEEARVRRAVYQLKRDQFVKTRKMGNRVCYALTEKGREAGLIESVRLAEPLPKGEYCMISFDIPEQERSFRQRLRLFLIDLDFKMDHESLWFSEFDVLDPISRLLKAMDVFKWVHLYKAKIIK